MRFARLARKFEGLQFGHRFLSNWMNCLGVIVQSVLKDFYLEDSIIIIIIIINIIIISVLIFIDLLIRPNSRTISEIVKTVRTLK